MKTIQTRKNHTNFFNSPFLVGLLVVLLLLSIKGVLGLIKKYSIAKEEKEYYEQKYYDLQKKEGELQDKIDYLETDQGKEYELKKKGVVSNPYEKVIKIIE